MDVASLWTIDIIAPAILLIVLIWLVIRPRSNRSMHNLDRSEDATRALYRDEEQRRRDRTDQL